MERIEVVAAVIVSRGKILATQRGVGKWLEGKWEFPGGKLKEGESYEEALIREIDEELNCKIKVGNPICRTLYDYPHIKIALSTYYASLLDEVPELMEHQALSWVEPSCLQDLDWSPADIQAVEEVIKEYT